MEGIFSGFKFSASLASFKIQYGILLCLVLSTFTFFQTSTLNRNHHRGINRLRIPIDISKRLGRSEGLIAVGSVFHSMYATQTSKLKTITWTPDLL